MFWNLGLKGLLSTLTGKLPSAFTTVTKIFLQSQPAAQNLLFPRQRPTGAQAVYQDSRRHIGSGRSKERPVTLLRNLARGEGRELESDKKAPFFSDRKKKQKGIEMWELWVNVYCVTKIILPGKATRVQPAAFLQMGRAA